MIPEIEERFLGGDGLEAYYVEIGGPAMAVDVEDPERRRMYELVAWGLQRIPPVQRRLLGRTAPPGLGGIMFLAPKSVAEADPLAVKALSLVLKDEEPGWVAAVQEARAFSDSAEVLAAFTGCP